LQLKIVSIKDKPVLFAIEPFCYAHNRHGYTQLIHDVPDTIDLWQPAIDDHDLGQWPCVRKTISARETPTNDLFQHGHIIRTYNGFDLESSILILCRTSVFKHNH
jgi:hypothetical protein